MSDNIAQYLKNLDAKDPKKRVQAATLLGELGDRKAVPELIIALKENPDVETRIAAAEALGKLGDRTATELLIKTFKQDPDKKVKIAMLCSLGELGDDDAYDTLMDAMLNEKLVGIREAAI